MFFDWLIRVNSGVFAVYFVLFLPHLATVDLSIIFVAAVVVEVLALKLIPHAKRVTRFVVMSVFFSVDTLLIVALIGSPLSPVFRPKDLPREFWLQILTCVWWALAARELIALLKLLARFQKAAVENKLLFDVISAAVYVCSALAMMGFVFGWPLQGLLATSGIIAIVLGLALQSTLSDLFSGISLTIEKPYELGDDILLEGGIEGQVVEVNWRSTHLRNGANDRVIIPNSAIAKMRIQNHSAGTKRYSGTLSVTVDSRNEVDVTMELLKQAAMTCTKILRQPPTKVNATDIKGDRVTYDVSFNTATFNDAGEAKSELISQIYKRARPVAAKEAQTESLSAVQAFTASPILFFPETEILDHLRFFDPLSSSEKAGLSEKMGRQHFQAGEKLLTQGEKSDAIHFVFMGVIQVSHQITDGRTLEVHKVGPGDSFGQLSILTGTPSPASFNAVTSGLLLQFKAEDLKPIIAARPELAEELCHYVSKMQEFIASFERSALQPIIAQQHDLIWRVKSFFRLGDRPFGG
ncbi:MAG: mechanosensitive ion channel [Verrucomicrobia bacterium]|nr:mechanosensitive ion channel [Verrucomicrobiota bacterium]